jgi:hypothetical protein
MNPVWFGADAAIQFRTMPTAISPRFMLTRINTPSMRMHTRKAEKQKSPITRGWFDIIEKCGFTDGCSWSIFATSLHVCPMAASLFVCRTVAIVSLDPTDASCLTYAVGIMHATAFARDRARP